MIDTTFIFTKYADFTANNKINKNIYVPDQGHSLSDVLEIWNSFCFNDTGPTGINFHMDPPWVKRISICLNMRSHDIDGCQVNIWWKFFSRMKWLMSLQTWYTAAAVQVLPCLLIWPLTYVRHRQVWFLMNLWENTFYGNCLDTGITSRWQGWHFHFNNIKSVRLAQFLKHQWNFIDISTMMHPVHCHRLLLTLTYLAEQCLVMVHPAHCHQPLLTLTCFSHLAELSFHSFLRTLNEQNWNIHIDIDSLDWDRKWADFLF